MTDAAERFISTQMTNFSERLSSLHSGGGGGADLSGLSILMNGRPLYAVPHPAGRPPNAPLQRLGIWADGTFGFGSRVGTPARSNANFGRNGMSAGIDYRVADRLAIGVGAGYAREKSDLSISGDQGMRENATALATYGSLRVGRDGFVDGLVGWGTMRVTTRRVDPMTSSVAVGSRGGNDLFASIRAGQRIDAGRYVIAPYAGIAAGSATLKAYTETGAGAGTLAFGNQFVRDVSASLGVRADTRFDTTVGAVSPHVAFEYRRRLSASSIAPVWYADRPATVYGIGADQVGSQPLELTAGGTLRTQGGFLFTIDYRSIIDRAAVLHVLRLGLSKRV